MSRLPNLVEQVARALVLYSMAEVQLGHARSIRVELEGCTFSIEDDGRGHGIARTVDGAPYLQFIYTHLDYPFEDGQPKPIQLQGLGMSLINAVCSDLMVHVRKPAAQVRMKFQCGRLVGYEHLEGKMVRTGNTISGCVDRRLETRPADVDGFRVWLSTLAAAQPSATVQLNGQHVLAGGESAA